MQRITKKKMMILFLKSLEIERKKREKFLGFSFFFSFFLFFFRLNKKKGSDGEGNKVCLATLQFHRKYRKCHSQIGKLFSLVFEFFETFEFNKVDKIPRLPLEVKLIFEGFLF